MEILQCEHNVTHELLVNSSTHKTGVGGYFGWQPLHHL